MKSVIEEASSISKAIENGWKLAGQPTEFTVRVFELPQKNMFGFTTKPAKIAIFFQDQNSSSNKRTERSHSTPTVRPTATPHTQASREKHTDALQSKDKAPVVVRRPTTEKPRQSTSENSPWNKEMVEFSQEWMKTLLSKLEVQSSYTVTPEHYHLKISFDKAVFDTEDKNRTFFRNCAYLLLQSMRNKFKRALKGFKIVLTVTK